MPNLKKLKRKAFCGRSITQFVEHQLIRVWSLTIRNIKLSITLYHLPIEKVLRFF